MKERQRWLGRGEGETSIFPPYEREAYFSFSAAVDGGNA